MYLTANEAADFLRVSRTHLHNLIRAGKIKAYKPSGRLYFLKSELQEYVESALVPPAPKSVYITAKPSVIKKQGVDYMAQIREIRMKIEQDRINSQ